MLRVGRDCVRGVDNWRLDGKITELNVNLVKL